MEIVNWFSDTFIGKSLLTFFMAMLPIVELRGSIPVGVALGLDVRYSLLLSLIGNILPVPFIIVFIRRILVWLQTKSKWLDRVIKKKVEKTMRHQDLIIKYELIGLMILVAIPLPGTGAWTGALFAAFLDLRLKNAFPAILLGVIIAGIIVTIITYGFSTIIS